MALADDLIITARQLTHLHERRPRQVDLRRAISTACYAAFHGLAEVALAGLRSAPRDEQLDFITLALGMTRS